jgi:hypothetical protein
MQWQRPWIGNSNAPIIAAFGIQSRMAMSEKAPACAQDMAFVRNAIELSGLCWADIRFTVCTPHLPSGKRSNWPSTKSHADELRGSIAALKDVKALLLFGEMVCRAVLGQSIGRRAEREVVLALRPDGIPPCVVVPAPHFAMRNLDAAHDFAEGLASMYRLQRNAFDWTTMRTAVVGVEVDPELDSLFPIGMPRRRYER